jgi:hypothetical protein
LVVAPNGELKEIGDKEAAYLDHKDSAPDLDTLRKERAALAARIADIDAILIFGGKSQK